MLLQSSPAEPQRKLKYCLTQDEWYLVEKVTAWGTHMVLKVQL